MACSAALAAATTVLVVGLPRTLAGEVEDDAAHAGVLAGIRVVASTPPLRAPFVLLAGLTMLEGSTDVQLVALAIDRLDLGNGGPGLLYLVWGAGGLAGSVVMLRIVRRTGYGRVLLVGAHSSSGCLSWRRASAAWSWPWPRCSRSASASRSWRAGSWA
jgi:hypothetical protein